MGRETGFFVEPLAAGAATVDDDDDDKDSFRVSFRISGIEISYPADSAILFSIASSIISELLEEEEEEEDEPLSSVCINS